MRDGHAYRLDADGSTLLAARGFFDGTFRDRAEDWVEASTHGVSALDQASILAEMAFLTDGRFEARLEASAEPAHPVAQRPSG